MEIAPRKLKDILMQNAIERKDIFIFVATPYSMKNKDRVAHCTIAARFSKTMYAVVKRGIISKFYWRKFKQFPWKTVYMFKTEEDLDYIMKDLLKIAAKESKRKMKKRDNGENIGYA
jgi:hypothetical protein